MAINDKLQRNNRVTSRRDAYSLEECDEVYQASWQAIRSASNFAREGLGIGLGKFRYILRRRKELMEKIGSDVPFAIERKDIGDDIADVDDIIERRRKEFKRRDKASKTNALIPCKVKIDGPIGILHMGDNHVDDPGTNISLLEKHIDLINSTEVCSVLMLAIWQTTGLDGSLVYTPISQLLRQKLGGWLNG